MILITGAAGKTGRCVIRELAASGVRVRALVHHEAQRQSVEGIGVAEVLAGDLTDRRIMEKAVLGVRAVYHIPPNVHPDEVTIGKTVIAAAQAAGVEHFVYHSVLHPQIEAMPHHWLKMRVEEHLFSCGLPFTILQPTAYMQNLLAQWDTWVEEGWFRVPYPVETRLSLVDLNDVAEVARRVITEEGHAGATYELVGTLPMSQIEVAGILSAVLERRVNAETTPLDVWKRGAQEAGLGSYAIDTLMKMFDYYDQNDFVGSPQILSRLLERPPTDLLEVIARERRKRENVN